MLFPDLAHRGTHRLQTIWGLFAVPVLVVIALVAFGGPHPASTNASLFAAIAGVVALIDFGSAVLHVFHPFTRDVYDLEGLWRDAPRLLLEPRATGS